MIITITMNPAIDKTISIDRLNRGSLNRITSVRTDAGGKGINVSRAVRKLGSDSISVGLAGGRAGRELAQLLDQEGICHDFVWIPGESRINTKICEADGTTTELNEAGPGITGEDLSKLFDKLETYCSEHTLFVLSGSAPTGISTDIYARMIRFAHEHQVQVLLDADGELLKEGLRAVPDMVKPNREELIRLAHLPSDASAGQLIEAGRCILDTGVDTVAITLGGQGAVLLCGDQCLYSPAIEVEAGSTVGAGDAFIAGMAHAWEQQLPLEETMKLAMAASAGAVMTDGTGAADYRIVHELMKQVKIKKASEMDA